MNAIVKRKGVAGAARGAAAALGALLWHQAATRAEARTEAVQVQRAAFDRAIAEAAARAIRARADEAVAAVEEGDASVSKADAATSPDRAENAPVEAARALLAALEGMAAREDLFDRDLYLYILRTLTAELARDEAALDWVLAEYRRVAETEYGGMIGAVLGLVDDPRVERTALDLVDADNGLARRIEGLRLLDRLDSTNPETRTALLDLIRTDPDPMVIGSAIYGLGRVADHPAEAERVAGAVRPLASHWDPEVRRRALIALAEWTQDPADLEPVIATLGGDDEALAVAAAFALGRTRVDAPAAVSALRGRMSDAEASTSVRERAWRSLTRLAVDADTARAMEAYEGVRPDLLGFDPNAAPEIGPP